MLTLTKTDGSKIVINPDMIEFVEKTPDTVITMSTGEKLLVKEPPEYILQMIIVFRRKVFHEFH
ncbi:MAG TPA: flagellar FlbD family protein [Nitrospirota bacterium]|jgi:flagellar protein FlbD